MTSGSIGLYLDHIIDRDDIGNILNEIKICKDMTPGKFMLILFNQNLSENAEEMLHCLTNVLLRLHPGDELQHLTQIQEAELLGWDAEKYRKSIQR